MQFIVSPNVLSDLTDYPVVFFEIVLTRQVEPADLPSLAQAVPAVQAHGVRPEEPTRAIWIVILLGQPQRPRNRFSEMPVQQQQEQRPNGDADGKSPHPLRLPSGTHRLLRVAWGAPRMAILVILDLGLSGAGERGASGGGERGAGVTNLGDADLPGFGVSDAGVPKFSSGLLLAGGGSFITKWVVVGGLAFRTG